MKSIAALFLSIALSIAVNSCRSRKTTSGAAKDPDTGEGLYASYCTPCHGEKGCGAVGPNLRDAYWINGNTAADITRIINDGVPKRGMRGWKDVLTPEQIQLVTQYILSLPASGGGEDCKEPEGKKY